MTYYVNSHKEANEIRTRLYGMGCELVKASNYTFFEEWQFPVTNTVYSIEYQISNPEEVANAMFDYGWKPDKEEIAKAFEISIEEADEICTEIRKLES